jgi:choline dehydrogenase-like flavoprotein
MPQILSRNANVFDAVVVGSGATGGWAAKQLTEAGMRVALLDAGHKVTPAEFSEHVQPYELAYRGRSPQMRRDRPIQSRLYACRESNYHWFANEVENPYTTPEHLPFHWIRMRVLGGRSLSWGRGAFRMSDLDFKAAGRDGWGEDWPISAADIEPHYRTVEEFIGVSGQAEGLPQLPDSSFLPPIPMYCAEERLKQAAAKKFGRVVSHGRTAVLTRPHNGRAACHYCGPCEQGCITNSYFSSPFTTLAAAEKTGRLTLHTDAVASHITVDPAIGLASGVAYLDRATRQAREVRAKVVVLCASTLESTRLLLNSKPGGLANSSGALGHYLMDHLYDTGIRGEAPLEPGDRPPWFGVPESPGHIIVPRFRNVKESESHGFLRGYHITGGCRPAFRTGAPGFGADYKRAARDGAWIMRLTPFIECLPRYENYVELDRNAVDAWGIPALRIHMSWGENELAMWKDARQQCVEMLEAAGARNVPTDTKPSVPGFCIHEVGTARMGANAKTSVLNRYHQAHDIKNLFVTDGAAYTTSACQNPTLTMMANTVRACDYIVDQARKGELG